MLRVELSEPERATFEDVLQSELPKLEIEIERTDGHDFRELLKHRRDILRSLLHKVGEPVRIPG